MSIQQLEELRGKLAHRQDQIAKAFEESAKKNDKGETVYDLSQVKVFGDGLNASDVAAKIRETNNECNDLGEEIDNLAGAEKAYSDNQRRESAPAGGAMVHPSGEKSRIQPVKSLGDLVTGEKRYQEWAKNGAAGGLTFNLKDAMASDILAKGRQFDTLGTKALFETTSGWAPESVRIPGFVEQATRPVQLLDIVPLSQTGMEQVVYMEETTRTHSAAETAEGATFQESAFELTERTSPVRKITDSVPVTDEQLEDVAQASSYLNSRVTFGLRQRLDSQILLGDGVGVNLTGLKETTGIQTQDGTDDPRPDAFFKAMTKIRLGGRAQPTHIVVHPQDWEPIRLMKTTDDGLYIWGHPAESGPERMWGLPVVHQDVDDAGTGYVGSFQPQWISLFERRGVDVQVGFTGTQFTEGKRTIRADMRFAFVVFRPAAFCAVENLGATT